MKRLQLKWQPKVGWSVKWADPCACDIWDSDLSKEANIKAVNRYLNTVYVITDIRGDVNDNDTVIELDGRIEVRRAEICQTNNILSLNRDPFLLKKSLSGHAIVNYRWTEKKKENA